MRKSNAKSEKPSSRQSVAQRLAGNQALIDPGPQPASPPGTPAKPKEALVTIAHRWPRALVDALIQASAARKVARQKPWLQQEITAEAMREWLERHGPKPSK
jgi:hypothetical protein